jgi:hypothetical protein
MSRARRGADLVRLASGVLAAVALGAVIVSSAVLLRRFQPDLQAAWDFPVPGGQHFAPRTWVSLHESAMDVAGVTVLIWFVTTLRLGWARSRRSMGGDIAAAIAFIGTWATNASWSHVRWNQVALWPVTLGTNYAGLWRPAVSDQVRFVLIGGSRVGQDAYLGALLIHLVAPVVAMLAVGASTYIASRRPAPEVPPWDEPGVELLHG